MKPIFHGIRLGLRRPLISLTAALCLSVGLAACTIAWSMIDAAIMRPFGLNGTDRLAVLWETDPSRQLNLIEVSLLNFQDWQRESRTVEAMAAFGSTNWPVLARIGTETVPVVARGVSTTFFSTIGVQPMLGRDFVAADAEPTSIRPVMLSHRMWQSRFGGNRAIIDQQVFIDGQDHKVIGVMPAGFGYPDDPDAWISVERVLGNAFANLPEVQRRRVGVLEVIARRRPEISNNDVRNEMTGIVRILAARHGAKDTQIRVAVTPFTDVLIGALGARLWIAVAMALAVLLFACANVASVRLAQGRERAAELAARTFLGASSRRVAADLALEAVAVVVGATILAALIWYAMVGVLSTTTVIADSGVDLFQHRTVAAVLLVVLAVIAWLLVGVVPASWQARSVGAAGLISATRITARTSAVGAPLLLAQTAVAITVVAIAAAALQAFDRLSRIDLGFATRDVVFADFSIPTWKYPSVVAMRTLMTRLEASLREEPAVAAVAAVSVRPFRFGDIVDGQPVRRAEDADVTPEDAVGASRVISTADYFDALGLPIVEGRAFTRTDRADTQPVAIVSRTLARTLWGDEAAIGKRIDLFSLREQWRSRLVVGVAGDARYRGLERPSMEVYVPDTQAPPPIGSFVIRTAAAAPAIDDVIRRALRRAEPEIALDRVQTTADVRRSALGPARLLATLMTVLGAAGILLLALGIFGVVATALRAAWSEIAVRQAIGAMPLQAARAPLQVLGRALVTGVVVGLLLTPLALSAVESMGLTRDAGMTLPLAAAALVVLIAALAATWPSLRRAAKTSPADLLREM